MTKKRNLTLTPRKEEEREAVAIALPVQFSLDEIQKHFSVSMAAVKNQYDVAVSDYISKIEAIVNAIYQIAVNKDSA